jgi:hypothetical protein
MDQLRNFAEIQARRRTRSFTKAPRLLKLLAREKRNRIRKTFICKFCGKLLVGNLYRE